MSPALCEVSPPRPQPKGSRALPGRPLLGACGDPRPESSGSCPQALPPSQRHTNFHFSGPRFLSSWAVQEVSVGPVVPPGKRNSFLHRNSSGGGSPLCGRSPEGRRVPGQKMGTGLPHPQHFSCQSPRSPGTGCEQSQNLGLGLSAQQEPESDLRPLFSCLFPVEMSYGVSP